MFGAGTETTDVMFIVGFSAGGALIATIVVVWLRSRKR